MFICFVLGSNVDNACVYYIFTLVFVHCSVEHTFQGKAL